MIENTVLIVYFSGTGGTNRIARTFETSAVSSGHSVLRHSLDINEYSKYKNNYYELINNAGILILLFPVHAFDAPKPVYEWLHDLPLANGLKTAVISVSGGGEEFPNTACRRKSIKALEKKGYNVFYERMMVMPANCMGGTNDHLAIRLLNILPEKVNIVLEEIFSEKARRSVPSFGSVLASSQSSIYRKMTGKFGRYIKTDEKCTSCGWCGNSCPTGNIKLESGRPVFGKKCILCLRCFYGCPSKSISATKFNSFLLKGGYSLNEIKRKMSGVAPNPIEECAKGPSWAGARRYLLDKENW